MTERTTSSGLMIIAFISAVLNFAGLSLLIEDGDWWLKSLCALTAVGVWVSLYLFWAHAFSIVPDLKCPETRLGGWSGIAAGCIVIIALSAYWNVVALAGHEARRLSIDSLVPKAEMLLAEASVQSSAYLGLKPQLNAFAVSLNQLSGRERTAGALTGMAGSGGVEETLFQISGQVALTAKAIVEAAVANGARLDEAKTCLADLRDALRGEAAETARLNSASGNIDCLNQAVADLGNQDVIGIITRSLDGLTDGIVMPATLRLERQRTALADAFASIQRQADAIAESARQLDRAPPAPLIVEQPNVMLAVLMFWRGLIPAIATALAVDLLPLILLILKVLRHRDQERQGRSGRDWTLQDIATLQGEWRALTGIDRPRLPAPERAEPFEPDDDWWDAHRPEGDHP